MSQENFNKAFVLLLLLFISAVFLAMIRQFLMTILLAAIVAGLSRPFYRRLERWFGGRRSLAAGATLLVIVFLVLIPLTGLLGAVTAEAIKVSQAVRPWIQEKLSKPDAFTDMLKSLPFYDLVLPYRDTLFLKAGEMVGRLSSYLINSLSSVTVLTAQFLFMTLILLYTLFFFLVDGERLLKGFMCYLPLKQADEERMLDKFTSVTRATLKGVAVIGILQGSLAGAAFAVVGIPSAVFWGSVMSVMSMVPGIGTAIVWVPAAIILAGSGSYGKAVGLTLFCALVVGGLDNLLRPRLVGKDTRMHELLIFFGTLGGIMMFGLAGIIIGPIVAALVVTVWEIYGMAFRDVLPDGSASPPPEDPPSDDPRILIAENTPPADGPSPPAA